MVTTLLEAQHYSAEALTQLYGYRWQASEVNLRYIKTTLKIGNADRQTCHGPQGAMDPSNRPIHKFTSVTVTGFQKI